MPEEPEIDTDKMREQIAEEADRGGALLRRIALTTALLAVFATLAALKAGAAINAALMLRTEATRLQAEASDQWAFYQAKGLRAAVEDATRAAWLAQGKDPPTEYAEKREHHAAEQREIEAKAREKEPERDEKLANRTTCYTRTTSSRMPLRSSRCRSRSGLSPPWRGVGSFGSARSCLSVGGLVLLGIALSL